jgi:hypothetical protein
MRGPPFLMVFFAWWTFEVDTSVHCIPFRSLQLHIFQTRKKHPARWPHTIFGIVLPSFSHYLMDLLSAGEENSSFEAPEHP